MGLLGNLGDTFSNMRYALGSLIYHPMHNESTAYGIMKGSLIFVKHSTVAILGAMGNMAYSFGQGVKYLVSSQN